MIYLENLFTTVITLKFYLIAIIALIYILIHQYRHKTFNAYLDVILNYIPVLTHEFGHVLFNKISGGSANDLVIVTRPSERQTTLQQGFAITQSSSRLGQIITTFGGYVMPPIMLLIGVLSAHSEHPIIFLLSYIAIFIYFLVLTSRKIAPIVLIVLFTLLLYLLVRQDNPELIFYLVSLSYHFILGVLLGEVLQSTWTIFKLTFQRPKSSWDGQSLTEMTFVPTFVYSAIWIAINLYSLYLLYQLTFY